MTQVTFGRWQQSPHCTYLTVNGVSPANSPVPLPVSLILTERLLLKQMLSSNQEVILIVLYGQLLMASNFVKCMVLFLLTEELRI